ncbi:hypothetical protein D9758_008635 [Tetrapyrgos nigripes]|uniref:GH18 domain-containing protein n=1 Tax=Tetrapyrgos nigripes TaxID=182062 RepID=A0A8H5FXV2_9AGAR|nr:hypothetical protein D9758_008635 [Tetrapyrgos nigripes]
MLSLISSPLCLPLIASSLSVVSGLKLPTGPTQQKPRIASAYFTGWHTVNSTPTFEVSDISWEKYNRMIYAFAETTEDPHAINITGSNPDALAPFVAAAHKNNVSAIISIGGWTGSRFWSTVVGSPENRTTFVKTVVDFTVQYNLDGLDFDWETPVKQAIGCNAINPNDTTNLVEFLKELRQDPVGAKLDLSAAVGLGPYRDSDGNPLGDMSEFGSYLDTVMIMNYDVWGSWSSGVGPNAPLNDTCAAPDNQQGSAVSAIKAWTDAGVPLEKIVLGVASYGHSFAVAKDDAFVNGSTTELAAYPPFNASAFPLGDSWDTDADTPFDVCGAPTTNGGNWDLFALIDAGLLDECGNPIDDVPYRFDECSKTAYVYRPDQQVMISFDDPKAFNAKGQFIKDMGLAGFAMWELGGDSDDILVDAIRETAGF